MKENKNYRILFLLGRFIATIIGFYQANLFFFSAGTDSVKHLVFVGIAVVVVFGLWKRPKWFSFFFGFLLLQQWYTQGIKLYEKWTQVHLFDIKSFAILFLMPIIFIALLKDKKHASETP